ncbi:MAG: SDR family NAD-dependent epimerase/dehydratase [Planctomycetota bacterium]|nr:MAG: SDR family NAD-dependent epimerase/dehydratase [Planctomycetota bacterium]
MKIVVTGAIGHIGSYVIRDFAVQFPGAEIVMIDNMMTQRFPSLFNLPALGQYRFMDADVTTMDLAPVLKDAHVVIHLAAITDAAGSFDKAAQVEANNFRSTVKVANACLDAGVRLIALSSTSVYGTQNEVVSEDCTPEELKPQSPYAVTKLKEEELITQLCAEKGLKAISCRFGTIFGASLGMRFHTAVNKFCWQAAMGLPITVWSTAYDQKRPYLDLFDASRAIAFIIRKDLFDGRIYNVLTHNATVRQVVDTIREFVPDLQVAFVDNKIMNQLSYEVSCERFMAEGFAFAGDLRRGIGETIGLLRQASC